MDWMFLLQEQPQNSYDNNVLDLCFFASLQADTWKLKRADTIDGLIANVQAAFAAYDPDKLNRAFLSHACCLDQIILHNGCNNYHIPHMKKQHLERLDQLPRCVKVSEAAKEHLEHLEEQNNH